MCSMRERIMRSYASLNMEFTLKEDWTKPAYRISSGSIIFAAELLLYVALYVKLIDELNVKNILNKNTEKN